MLDLSELGEFGLIEVLRRRAGARSRSWRLVIGDDAALLRPRAGHDLVWTVDALMEGVHFRWTTTEPRLLGRKALRINLSDVAAMGARPLGFLLTLSLPPETPPERLDGFVAGLLKEAATQSCPLVGGDTTRASSWALSISVVGEVAQSRELRRDRARVGDRLMLVGELGASALGLHVLERGAPRDARERRFARRHQLPDPPIGAGPLLARRGWARAALDVSDGLASDLGHLVSASRVAAEVQLERLPLARGFRPACFARGLDPERLALIGGEDYGLLFAAPAGAPDASSLGRRLGKRVTEIGRIVTGSGIRWMRGAREVEPTLEGGFEHFKPL